VQFKRLAKISQSFLFGAPLAGDIYVQALRDEPVALTLDSRGKVCHISVTKPDARFALLECPVRTAFVGTDPNAIRQSDCESGEDSLKITTAVEDAKDRYGIGGDQERNPLRGVRNRES
jgi:hypothetical protein